jgi:hypothetical protein
MVKDPNQKGKTGTGPKQSRLAHLFMYDAVHGEFAEGQHAFGSAAVPIDIRCLAAGLQELSDWTNAGHWTVPLVDFFQGPIWALRPTSPTPDGFAGSTEGLGVLASPGLLCCVFLGGWWVWLTALSGTLPFRLFPCHHTDHLQPLTPRRPQDSSTLTPVHHSTTSILISFCSFCHEEFSFPYVRSNPRPLEAAFPCRTCVRRQAH